MIWLLIATSIFHFVIGSLTYVRNTFNGRSQPNRVSFFFWALAPFISLTAVIVSQGWSWPFLPVFIAGFGPLLIFLASFANPKAYWKLGIFDYVCGFFAMLALVLWILTKEPVVAVFFSILSDLCAGLPTLAKAWKHPETETGIIYVTAFVSEVIAIVLVNPFTFLNAGFLIYLLIMNALLGIAVFHKDPIGHLRSDFGHKGGI